MTTTDSRSRTSLSLSLASQDMGDSPRSGAGPASSLDDDDDDDDDEDKVRLPPFWRGGLSGTTMVAMRLAMSTVAGSAWDFVSLYMSTRTPVSLTVTT